MSQHPSWWIRAKERKMFIQSDWYWQLGRKKFKKIDLSQTYDLLVTIQPDALPLSYRPNDEWWILSLANTWERCFSSFSCILLDKGFWTRKTMTNLTECGVTLLHFFTGFLVRVPTWQWRTFKSVENSNSCCYSIKMFLSLIWPLCRSVSQKSKRNVHYSNLHSWLSG